jgi:hypothetical protein
VSFTNLRRQFSEDGFRDVFFHIHLVIMGSFITRRLSRRVTIFGEENSKLPANGAVMTPIAIQACAGPIRLQPKTETAVVFCLIMVLI